MSDGLEAITYAVRLGVVAKYLGQLALMLALVTLVPSLVAFALQDYGAGWRFLGVVLGLMLVGVPLARLPSPRHMQPNEALVIVALAYLFTPLIMVYPLMSADLSFTDAFFEAVSAVTTTGLTTVDAMIERPPSFLFARAWIQWYAGLGIVVLSVALLMGHHVATRRLVEPAVGEGFISTARTHARHMLIVYVALTAVGMLIVWLLAGDWFVSLNHVLTAISTAGFSMYDNNLAGLDSWWTRLALISLALLGAVPLPLYYRAFHEGWRAALVDVELRALLVLVVIVITALSLTFWRYGELARSWQEMTAHALLLGISAQSSTGFSSLPVANLDSLSKGILILSMIIGGGLGSTAGGVKVLRLLLILRLAQMALRRTALPEHAVAEPRLAGKILEPSEVNRALLLIWFFGVTIVASWLVFLGYGYPPLDALFEVVSATGTVGLSSGVTAPDLDVGLKYLLCLDMLLGRVEVVAILVLLYRPTWIGKRAKSL